MRRIPATAPVPKSKKKAVAKAAAKPTANSNKAEAVARLAYDKADTALKVANSQTELVTGFKKAIESLEPVQAKGYTMNVNRNSDGFISSIDVEINK